MSFTKPKLFALVDCNNFYASCERVFNPRLNGKPIVVLSNNDGCVIARSNEAKVLGIPMGAPYFEFADMMKANRVTVFSSNYTLYGEMSQRVMRTLEQFTPELEIYSIDEAFLNLENQIPKLSDYTHRIKQTVYQWTGIPISIGVAPTKTLAKVANKYAKKHVPKEGYFILNDPSLQETILKNFSVEDVWGIGRQITALLYRNGIRTAWELACADDHWIKKNLSIVGLRTVWELRGISCLPLEESPPPKKSIVRSRSFGCEIFTESDLAEALSCHVASAAETLRSQGGLTSFIEVFLTTSRFKDSFYCNSTHITLPIPSDYTPDLITCAKKGLKKIYRNGFAYKKIGVMLSAISPNQTVQQDLFEKDKGRNDKYQLLMELMDKTNAKYGRELLKSAAQGVSRSWAMTRSLSTQHFTTSWDGLLKVKI